MTSTARISAMREPVTIGTSSAQGCFMIKSIDIIGKPRYTVITSPQLQRVMPRSAPHQPAATRDRACAPDRGGGERRLRRPGWPSGLVPGLSQAGSARLPL